MSDEVDVATNWLSLMGLALGQEIVVLSRGASGRDFQGFLVNIVVGPSGPLLIVIRQDEDSPLCSIPWDGVLMVTLPNPALAAAREAAQAAVPADISVADLEEMAKAMGLEIPEQIQELMDGEK